MRVWLQHVGTAVPCTLLCLDQFPFTVGRQHECDGCLPYAFISRQHCCFTNDHAGIRVQDLESYHGTFVNGQLATLPLPLRDGDEVTLGPLNFRVLIPAALAETVYETPTEVEIDFQRPVRPRHES